MMKKCEGCGVSYKAFKIINQTIIIDGSKYMAQFLECPCCGKKYLISVSACDIRKLFSSLIDKQQELDDVLYYSPKDEKKIDGFVEEIDEILRQIDEAVKDGQKLYGLINIK